MLQQSAGLGLYKFVDIDISDKFTCSIGIWIKYKLCPFMLFNSLVTMKTITQSSKSRFGNENGTCNRQKSEYFLY